jgi:DNA-binding MarR family transcriptional regulator
MDATGRTPAQAATHLAWALRRALAAHREAIAAALARHGYDDLPPRALWAIDALRLEDHGAAELARVLGVSKQAISPLVDMLATLDYLERTPDTVDRRRVTLRLTRRGRSAADVIAQACADIEARAREGVGAGDLARAGTALAAIAALAPPRR